MSKYIETVQGQLATESLGSFRRDLVERAALVAQSLPGLERLAGNICDVEPQRPAGPPNNYLAAIEYWFDARPLDAQALIDSAWHQVGPETGLRRWLYRVSERVQLDEVGARSNSPASAVKALYLVRRPDGLSNEDATRGWRDHAGTARKHHAGMVRYVQNGVIEALTSGAPVVHGIAELTFPTLRDLEERMYDSEAGREAISREASVLVGEVTTLYTTEHLFRAPTK